MRNEECGMRNEEMKNAEFCGGEPCAVLPPQRAASAASHGAKNLCSTQPQLRHMAQNNICSAAPQCRFQPKQSSGVRSLSCVRWRETIFVARRIAPSGRRGTNHLPQGQPRSAPACPRRGNGSRRGTVGPSAQGKPIAVGNQQTAQCAVLRDVTFARKRS